MSRGTKRVARKKIGRNEPCPCGSGKKWKNCHLLKAREIQEDIRKGAQYVRDYSSLYGVIKIKDAPTNAPVEIVQAEQLVKV